MAVADSINALYLSILGRPADAPGLANAVAAVGDGATLAQIAAGLASSPEGQAIIGVFYQAELGRAPDSDGLAGATSYLASGGTLSGLRSGLGTSAEAQSDLAAIYQTELGRAPDQPGLANFEQFLAAGGSLAAVRASVAASPEAQDDLAGFYQAILGRAPDSGGLAYYTQYLAGGGSQSAILTGIINSQEVTSDISNAYQSALGHAANAVELAAGRSELASGVSSAILQTELGELSGGPTPPFSFGVVSITPQTISGGAPNLVYSLNSNDALLASQPESVYTYDAANVGGANVVGFNPATDIIQVQLTQAASFADLHLFAASATDTALTLGQGGSSLFLNGVPETSLHASNFRFV